MSMNFEQRACAQNNFKDISRQEIGRIKRAVKAAVHPDKYHNVVNKEFVTERSQAVNSQAAKINDGTFTVFKCSAINDEDKKAIGEALEGEMRTLNLTKKAWLAAKWIEEAETEIKRVQDTIDTMKKSIGWMSRMLSGSAVNRGRDDAILKLEDYVKGARELITALRAIQDEESRDNGPTRK